MKKIKEFFKCVAVTLLAIAVYPAMVIHVAYQRRYFKNVILKELLVPVEDEKQEVNDGNRN